MLILAITAEVYDRYETMVLILAITAEASYQDANTHQRRIFVALYIKDRQFIAFQRQKEREGGR